VKRLGLATCLLCEHEPADARVKAFDLVRRFTPAVHDCRCRAGVLADGSPFDLTLMLDTDCAVLRDVSFGFELARRHGIALCIAAAANAVLCHGMAREYPADLVQYNAGVLFFDREAARPLLRRWSDYALHRPLSHLKTRDQPALAAAVYDERTNPFVLPPTWNLRPMFGQTAGFGPVTVWHAPWPVPPGLDGQQGFWRLTPFVPGEAQAVIPLDRRMRPVGPGTAGEA
jgi:hypothetical protein